MVSVSTAATEANDDDDNDDDNYNYSENNNDDNPPHDSRLRQLPLIRYYHKHTERFCNTGKPVRLKSVILQLKLFQLQEISSMAHITTKTCIHLQLD